MSVPSLRSGLGAQQPPAHARPVDRRTWRSRRPAEDGGEGPTLGIPWELLASGLLLLAGTAMWLRSLDAVDLGDVDDLGLISALPWSFWATTTMVLPGVVLAIWGRTVAGWLVGSHVVLLVLVLYGTGAALSPYPRGTVSWRHVGIAEQLTGAGEVDSAIDAYFSWPGFFSLLATFTDAAGLDDAKPLMRWAPVANELLVLLPLLLVLRALTDDRRLSWSAVVLFYCTNWIQQDYLSPQAFGFFLYVCVLGLVLTFLPGRGGEPPPGTQARSQALVLPLVLVLLIAMTAAHQLTPYAMVIALTVITATRRTSARGLPLVALVLVAMWTTSAAVSYMQGNLATLVDGLGDLTGAAQGNLTARVAGSPGHLVVVQGRLGLSLAIWSLGAAGALLRWRRGHRDLAVPLLAAGPGLLFVLQSYGGEMLLRIFLFSLPFTCLLAVHALPAGRGRRDRLIAGAVFLVTTLAITPAFVLTQYGNHIIDVRSEAEVVAVEELYRRAPEGALLLAGNDSTPWRYTEYDDHRHKTVNSLQRESMAGSMAELRKLVLAELANNSAGGYLLITRQQKEYERLLGRDTPYTLDELQQALQQEDRMRVVYQNADAVILSLPAEKAT